MINKKKSEKTGTFNRFGMLWTTGDLKWNPGLSWDKSDKWLDNLKLLKPQCKQWSGLLSLNHLCQLMSFLIGFTNHTNATDGGEVTSGLKPLGKQSICQIPKDAKET